jgi:hypothetical protein
MDGDRPNDPERVYANYVTIGHNAFEFVFEFGQLYNGGGEARVQARVVMSPPSAHELMQVLGEALREYDTVFPRHGEGLGHDTR